MKLDWSKRSALMQVVHFCLILVLLASLYGAFNLIYKESIRLLIITVGLLYLYTYRIVDFSSGVVQQQITVSRGYEQNVESYGPALLALVFMFVITQFDPRTSAIHYFVAQRRLNWFFVISSSSILIAFTVYLILRFTVKSAHPILFKFSMIDVCVLGTSLGVICLSVISKVFIDNRRLSIDDAMGLVKIAEYLVLYFVITGVYTISKPSSPFHIGLKGMFLTTIFAFSAILSIGIYRFSTAIFDYRTGLSLLKQGAYQDALGRLEAVNRKLNYSSMDVHLQIGKALLGTDDLQGAQDVFARTLALATDRSGIRKKIGDIYTEMKLWDQATKEYEVVRSTDGNYPSILSALALSYLKGGQQESLTDIIKTLADIHSIKAETPDECCMLGFALVENGRWNEAETYFKRAVETGHRKANAYYGMGLVSNRKGDWNDAVKYLQQALVFDTTSAEIYTALGQTYEGQGQLQEAAAVYESALKYHPSYIYALGKLSALYPRIAKGNLVSDLKKRMVIHVSASEWTGRAGGDLAWTGSCFKKEDLYQGELEIHIQAYGTMAQGIRPHMLVKLDEKLIGEADVSPTGDIYKFVVRIKESKRYRLTVWFTNDAVVNGEDRNLFVRDAIIQYR